MDIVIVGAGNVGLALAEAWRKAGHAITFAVRNPADSKAAGLKNQGFGVSAIAGAGGLSEVIVLALPWNAVATSVPALGPVAGKIIIDATNPLTANLDLAIGHTDSAGEAVARLAPHARVVKAFNTTGANNMADSRYPAGKPLMPVAGDDAEAKKVVMGLAAEIGFDPIDTGPLAMSRHLEPMAMVWIKLAFAQKLGRDFAFALLRR
jgi:8-hydroxy-5-deazaflavin:NADPH oxidoreductase